MPAPSSSMAMVRLANPNLPVGSSLAPAFSSSVIWTSGTSCDSTSHTGTPFDSVRFWMGGNFSSDAGPSAGGFARSGGLALRRRHKHAPSEPRAEAESRKPRARESSFRLRLDDELDAPIRWQPLHRGGLDIGGAERRVSREVLRKIIRATAGKRYAFS